jgi:hypothetical protein
VPDRAAVPASDALQPGPAARPLRACSGHRQSPAGEHHCRADQAAPLRGAGSGAPRAGLCLWGGSPGAPAPSQPGVPLIWKGHPASRWRACGTRLPRSRLSGSRPPRLGRPSGPSHAIGCADPRPGDHSPGFGSDEEGGAEQWPELVSRTGFTSAMTCQGSWQHA